MKRATVVSLFVFAFITLPVCFSFPAYCLKGWKGSEQEAINAKNALVAEGFNPVQVIRNAAESYVVLGQFPSWLDAKWYQMCFEKRGVNDLSIQGRLTLGNGSDNTAPRDFYLFGNDLTKNNVSLDINRREIVEFEKLRGEKNYPECDALADKVLSGASADDPIRGWATLKKGYLAFRDKRHEDALSHFLKVANGEVPAPRDMRLEAMNRVSRLYLAKGQMENLIRYYRGLDELQSLMADNPTSQAQLQADKAWIIMELARRSEKYGGTQEDTRRACEKALQLVMPQQAPQTCALAQLMYMESFAYEQKPEVAIPLAEQLIEKYPDQLREKAMALIFLGVLEYQRGNLEKGYRWLEKVHQLGLDAKNQAPVSFGNIYPLRHSALWLRAIARDMKRDDLQRYWDDYIKNNW
jgi:hypothetical protein